MKLKWKEIVKTRTAIKQFKIFSSVQIVKMLIIVHRNVGMLIGNSSQIELEVEISFKVLLIRFRRLWKNFRTR